MPATDGAAPLDRAAQARAGSPGRPLADGSQLVVLRSGGGEGRLARIAGGAGRASWAALTGVTGARTHTFQSANCNTATPQPTAGMTRDGQMNYAIIAAWDGYQ